MYHACLHAKSMPTFHFYVPKTCHFSNWCANVPKACQHFIFTCQRCSIFQIGMPNVPKGVPIFQLFFKRKSVSIMVSICKFQEYLENYRKFISRSKEFETKYFHICLFLPCTPQIFLKKHALCKMIMKLF